MKKRLTVLAALLACSTLMGSVHVYAEENEKNVVETAYGKVQGINSTDENYEDVVEFQDIMIDAILQDLTPNETESLVKALAKLNIWFRKAKA